MSASWNANFKKTNAVKFSGKATERRLTDAEISAAKSADPSPFIEAAGYNVRREGRHLSIRDSRGAEVYRSTLREGRYVTCTVDERPVGDTIELVKLLHHCSFVSAVARLNSADLQRATTPQIFKASALRSNPSRPTLPHGAPADAVEGRAYLRSRAINDAVISVAEKSGFVKFIPGAVVFAGYDDQGVCRMATRRATRASDAVQKRDFAGTNKAFPPILSGVVDTVWIVEGGIDALALHTLCKQEQRVAPSAVVSGGINVRSYLESSHVREMLASAKRIVVACEHEKDAATQAKTDVEREKLIEKIVEVAHKMPVRWVPEAGVKDLGELLAVRSKNSTPTAFADATGL